MAPVADEPMHGDARRYAYEHAPHHPRQAADHEQYQGQRQLLQHPGSLQEAIERVVTDTRARIKTRRARELQTAVKVPNSVPPQATPVLQEGVAVRLTLRPVADVVRADDPERALHTDQRPRPHEHPLKQLGTLKRTMDQAPVKSDGMSCAHGECQ